MSLNVSSLIPVTFYIFFMVTVAIYNIDTSFSINRLYNLKLPNLGFRSQERKKKEIIPGSKWIVVTSIQYPTEDIKRLAAQSGWKLVVIGDTKTPEDWSYPGVHYLSLEKQKEINNIANLLPVKSYTRKNIGYIYAIMNGAEYIYDTDDDNKPYELGLQQFDYTNEISGLRYFSKSGNMSEQLFNPYQFYGFNNMWPRGFPLEYLQGHNNGKNRMKLCRKMKPAAVQQGIVHNDPDVDAIFRLIYADRKSGLSADFNNAAPPIILEKGTYSPWNSQNTLFHYNAFFTMFLPTTVAFRVTDIWRSYFAQKMLHLIGEEVAFYPINAVQFRNAHNYLKDFGEEIDVYGKSGKIVEFLEGWTCQFNQTEECVLELADEFTRRDYWREEDKELMEAWINVLKDIGYNFPPLNNTTKYEAHTEKYGNCRTANLNFGLISYQIKEQKKPTWENNAVNGFGEVLSFCEKHSPDFNIYLPTPQEFEERYEKLQNLNSKKDTVLVLISNYPWKQVTTSIGLLQRLYYPFFKTVIFCGTWTLDHFIPVELKIIEPLNFINITEEEMAAGYFNYYCVSKVRDLRLQNVKGYYFVHDDSIFNLWHNLPVDVIVQPKEIGPTPDGWWNGEAAVRTMTLIEGKFKNDLPIQESWREYQKMLSIKTKFVTASNHMKGFNGKLYGDWVYLPTSQMNFFSNMFEVLVDAQVFVELAYAKLFSLLPSWERGGKFIYLWNEMRNTKYSLYSKDIIGLHPAKTASLQDNLIERKIFCNSVVMTFAQEIYGQPNISHLG